MSPKDLLTIVVCAVTVVIGLTASHFWPADIFPNSVQYSFGPGAIVFAGLAVGAAAMMHRKTPLRRRRIHARLMPLFGFSRSPLYPIALSILLLGVGITMDSLWLLLLAVPAALITHYVILPRRSAGAGHGRPRHEHAKTVTTSGAD